MVSSMAGQSEEIKMTYSCILSKGKKKIIRVTFERGKDFAEGIVPDGIIEKQQGFTKEEIEQLEDYLRNNLQEIVEQAKKITGIRHWLGIE